MTLSSEASHQQSIPIEEMTYEQAFQELEAVVNALETEKQPLDQTMQLFERGQILARRCMDLLDKAELRVRQLTGDELVDFTPQA
jgi:exodeoxyribonuclease VII small subunit